MLALFTIPKPFRGPLAQIQRNAIRSWMELRPACEVFLFGDDEGTAPLAREWGLRHVPEVLRNQEGTPLVPSLFEGVERLTGRPLFAYVNADIILLGDFLKAAEGVAMRKRRFLLTGRRWDLDWSSDLECSPGWEERLRRQVAERGRPHPPTGTDYFVYPRGLYPSIPPFAIGRTAWDNWLLFAAWRAGAAVVDASEAVCAVHQNHDYSHAAQGAAGVWEGAEARRNLELAGGARHLFTLQDAAWRWTGTRLVRVQRARLWRRRMGLWLERFPHLERLYQRVRSGWHVSSPKPAGSHPVQPSRTFASRFVRFMGKPGHEKAAAVRNRIRRSWLRLFPNSSFPVRLPYGGRWLAQNDVCSEAIAQGNYEAAEWRFVERFVQAGMTVLDLGAHHGFYSLLASKRAGPQGRVIAFEPSPREFKRLQRHVARNGCKNVRLEPMAVGSEEGVRNLFLVEGSETGCNSLRPPQVGQPTRTLPVPITTLDKYLQAHAVERIDFVKIDVEGGELDVLRGAKGLLERPDRPVFLCEIHNLRTEPWGYRASEILAFLEAYGYQWHGLTALGELTETKASATYNLVALPKKHPLNRSLGSPLGMQGEERPAP